MMSFSFLFVQHTKINMKEHELKNVQLVTKKTKMPKKPGVYTAKNGARYKILPNGKARFISGPSKRKGGKKKGGGLGGKKGGGMGSKVQNVIY